MCYYCIMFLSIARSTITRIPQPAAPWSGHVLVSR